MNDLLILPEQDYELLLRLQPPAHLRHELERAIVVSDEALPPDVVAVNSRVVYTDETTGVRRRGPHFGAGAGGQRLAGAFGRAIDRVAVSRWQASFTRGGSTRK